MAAGLPTPDSLVAACNMLGECKNFQVSNSEPEKLSLQQQQITCVQYRWVVGTLLLLSRLSSSVLQLRMSMILIKTNLAEQNWGVKVY